MYKTPKKIKYVCMYVCKAGRPRGGGGGRALCRDLLEFVGSVAVIKVGLYDFEEKWPVPVTCRSRTCPLVCAVLIPWDQSLCTPKKRAFALSMTAK